MGEVEVGGEGDGDGQAHGAHPFLAFSLMNLSLTTLYEFIIRIIS